MECLLAAEDGRPDRVEARLALLATERHAFGAHAIDLAAELGPGRQGAIGEALVGLGTQALEG